MKMLILLVGAQGSGKSTYCAERLAGYTRISQDDQGKQGHRDAFHAALSEGNEFIVVDRMNHSREQRGNYLAPAKKAGYITKIVWLNTDRNLCIKRAKARKNHPTLKPDAAEDAIKWYFRSFQTPSKKEVDELEIIGSLPNFVPVKDIRQEIGDRRYLVVGDIHGCLAELKRMLAEREFDPNEDVLVSCGDLVDRGPQVRETLEFVMSLPRFYAARGNHDDKCTRYFQGQPVKIANGLQDTIDSFGDKMPKETLEFLQDLPLILRIPAGYVVHAGFDPLMLPEEQQRSDCLFMRYYGGRSYFDDFNGVLWHKLWPRDWPTVFYGHIPEVSGPAIPNIISLDGGCVFGNYLKAYDSRDGIVHYINAERKYSVSEYAVAHDSQSNAILAKREEYVVAGLLRSDRTDDGKLAIYTYTDQCVFARAWDEITKKSRGHIYDVETGECMAYAFEKFFELGECEEALHEHFDWNAPYDVYEKLDGWISILYRHDGQFKCASRGSFHSAGAIWSTKFIQQFDLSCLPDEATLCFEMLTRNQRIILDYGQTETLIILAAFNRHDGTEYPRKTVEEWAAKIGIPIVKKCDISVDDCLRFKKENKDKEGFVIRFHDGRRVKVKTAWYLSMAKILSGVSPIAVWETMLDGKVQEEFLNQLVDRPRVLANGYKDILEGQYKKVMIDLHSKCEEVILANNYDKKSIALNRKSLEGTLAYKAVFAVMAKNEKALNKIIMDEIYPKGNEFVAI